MRENAINGMKKIADNSGGHSNAIQKIQKHCAYAVKTVRATLTKNGMQNTQKHRPRFVLGQQFSPPPLKAKIVTSTASARSLISARTLNLSVALRVNDTTV